MPAVKAPTKKLSRAQRNAFWFGFDRGELKPSPKRRLYWARSRAPVRVSSSIAGTVREFRNRKELQEHIRLVNATNKFGEKSFFATFNFRPLQLLSVDRQNFRTTEKIILGPNAHQVLNEKPENGFGSPYGKHFWRKMEEKKVSLFDLRQSLRDALREIQSKITEEIPVDAHPTNVIIVDYNPKTGLPTIAIVDHGPY